MVEDVKKCIEIRLEFFDKYYTVPENVQGEVDEFANEINSLGERCADAGEFEKVFASEGFMDRFNSILSRCTPKAIKMTEEQRQYSKEVEKELNPRKEVAKYIFEDAVDSVNVEIGEEMIAQRRKQMIEDGVYDEYTRATNYVDDAKGMFGFLKNMFGKKGEK